MTNETSNWGGSRPKQREDDQRGGKRSGAGRKQVKFNFGSIGDSFVMERGMVNDVPAPPEMWEIIAVTDDYFELQRVVDGTSEIITISRLDFWNGE